MTVDRPRIIEDKSNYKESYKVCPVEVLEKTHFRFLCKSDLPEVKYLCTEWFPVEYPDTWYEDVTNNPRFFALAAIYKGKIMGLLIAELKHLSKMNKEDQLILPPSPGKSIEVGYILALGVSAKLRRIGVASMLLDQYLNYLSSQDINKVEAVLLHVLTTNSAAILFYENRNFIKHSFIPYYYVINGKPRDGYSYVRYINGGRPPWSAFDCIYQFLTSVSLLKLITLPLKIMAKFFALFGQQTASSLPDKFF